MPVARNNIWTCDVFATSSFNFGLPTYFVSHYCYGRALYAVFYRKVFFLKKVEQMVWQMTCQRSHMFWCALCSYHVFVLLVQFALDHLKNIEVCLTLPETGVAFLQEDNHTHQFARVIFLWDWCLRLSPSLLTLFVIWHSGTTRFKYRFSRIKSADYFVLCIYMPLWSTLGIISSVEGIWLGVPLMRSLVKSHNFFATARKIIYAACSIQAGRFFIGQN